MLFYPQLLTGTVCQYPITRRNGRRTITNTLADGTNIRMADLGVASVIWDLHYSQLTTEELGGLQELFKATSGEWLNFTFLDPASNLFSWSEDLSQTAWVADALVALRSGVTDPFGATVATQVTNASQANQEIGQHLAAPGWFQYCLSAYVRSDEPARMELFASSGSDTAETVVTTGPEWRRVLHGFELSSNLPNLVSGLRLAAGVSVSVYGLQLEAQLAAGAYMRTNDRPGVYSKTRFQSGTLRPIATGVNQFACSVSLTANVAG